MRALAWVGIVAALVLGACAHKVSTATQAERLLDSASWTIQDFRASKEPAMQSFNGQLAKAAAVAIFPALYKAGFIVGAEGGNGVLIARKPDGSWGEPAFYTMGNGSVGLQIGGQVAETVLIIRSQGALQAIIKHQAKFGADLSVVGGLVGAGLGAATTTNAGADVVLYSRAEGAFGGASIEGGVMAKRTDWNEAVYGPGATPQGIILEGRYSTPVADKLRAALAGKS